MISRGAPGRILDRLAVAGKRQARRELDRPLQRREVVAERVGARVRVEPDGRRDRAEEVVAGDEDAVAQEAEVAVRVAGKLEHLPAVDLVALGDPLGVAREADERAERVASSLSSAATSSGSPFSCR